MVLGKSGQDFPHARTHHPPLPSSADIQPLRTSLIGGELMRSLVIHVFLASLLGLGAASVYATPADLDASPPTVALHNYLTNLPDQSDHRLISGQWGDWHGMERRALARQERIHDRTGQYPGLWGNTAWNTTKPPTLAQTFNLTLTTIKNTINWWNQGGLVEIGGFFPNPSSGGESLMT